MNTQQMNLLLVDVLNDWDPFHIGAGNYDTEIADVLQVIQAENESSQWAKKIQGIYEFSFEEVIPLAECKRIANKLVMIKNNSSCEIK